MPRVHAACVLLLLLAPLVALAEPTVLSGRAVDPDGKPVAGATAAAWDALASWEPRLVTATTDATGAFALPLKRERTPGPQWRHAILLSKPGLPSELVEGKPGGTVTVTLGGSPAARLGVVRRADGTPVAGATVRVEGLVSADDAEVRFALLGPGTPTTTTDAAGAFGFTGYGRSAVPSVVVSAAGLAAAEGTLARVGEPLEFILQATGAISGRVRRGAQPQAPPLPGLKISAYGGPGAMVAAVTAADGTYLLRDVPPGTVQMSVEPPAGLAAPPRRALALVPGQALKGVDFALTPGGLLRGTVLSAEGAPVAGAQVFAHAADEGGSTGNARTDAQGRYELRLRPDDYALICHLQDAQDPAQTAALVVRAGTVRVTEGQVVEKQDLVLKPPPKLSGVVLQPDGTPAAGAQVSVPWVRPGSLTAVTGADGRFEFSGGRLAFLQQQAVYVLAVRGDAVALASWQEGAPLKLQLQPGGFVSTRVSDEQGRALADTRLLAYSRFEELDEPLAQARSAADGSLRLGPLPAGRLLSISVDWSQIHLLVGPDWRERHELTLQPGQTVALPPVQLNPRGRSLPVFVGNPDGTPVAGASVYTERPPEPLVTDAKGRVGLTGLPLEGKVHVVAIRKAPLGAAAAIVDPTEGPWPGLLLQPLGEATGRVVPRTGTAGAAAVTCEVAEDRYSFGFQLRQALGLPESGVRPEPPAADGRWHARGLVAGLQYQVMVWTVWTPQERLGTCAGIFVATGGPGCQDVGTMQYTPPE